MHIAYIHQHFQTPQDKGGTRSYEMALRLIAAGHKVSMISGTMEDVGERIGIRGDSMKVDVDGIEVHYINAPYANRMSFWQRVAVFRQFAKRAQRVVESLRPDLIFATSTPLTVGDPARKAARTLGVPFVFEVRDLWPELPIAMGIIKNPALKWYLRHMERRIYRAAQHCIALSPGMKEGIAEAGFPEDRITIIPNAADLELFKPERTLPRDDWLGDVGCCRFVFSGAHGEANGLDSLIDAAVELRRRGESGIQFVCIGYGKLKPRLIERCESEGVAGMFLWADPVPKQQLARLLPTFEVGLMLLKNIPAFYRGTSPNKFFDYIASGLPVLNNYPGWLAGMIESEGFGKVTPPDDAKAFADACVWFRDHADERGAMRLRARAFAEREHSRDRRAGQFVEALERVAASAKS
ncbi:MAG: glycosyltransferase family 4 protein [Phycisphaerales bacterium]|nr:glycosyltransferase family 4 protein [Phycisphaerales bacterium]MCB9854183.1 glycosyltransferase family 4 protein [Phycisphaerales bacterium]